jgi:hypothetical protein
VFAARPNSPPPPGAKGKPRRLRSRNGETWREADAWARNQDWFPLVVNHHDGQPYSDARYYLWILREEP